MNDTLTLEKLDPWLRISDPNLPRLATRAAVELDGLRRNSGNEVKALECLRELLVNGIRQRAVAPALANTQLFDTGTMVSLTNAFKAARYDGPRKVNEFYERAAAVAEDLGAVASGAPQAKIDQVAEFCVALAREATTRAAPRRHPGFQPFVRR